MAREAPPESRPYRRFLEMAEEGAQLLPDVLAVPASADAVVVELDGVAAMHQVAELEAARACRDAVKVGGLPPTAPVRRRHRRRVLGEIVVVPPDRRVAAGEAQAAQPVEVGDVPPVHREVGGRSPSTTRRRHRHEGEAAGAQPDRPHELRDADGPARVHLVDGLARVDRSEREALPGRRRGREDPRRPCARVRTGVGRRADGLTGQHEAIRLTAEHRRVEDRGRLSLGGRGDERHRQSERQHELVLHEVTFFSTAQHDLRKPVMETALILSGQLLSITSEEMSNRAAFLITNSQFYQVSVSFRLSSRDSFLSAASRCFARDSEPTFSRQTQITGKRPRVYFAPRPALWQAKRLSTSVEIPI